MILVYLGGAFLAATGLVEARTGRLGRGVAMFLGGVLLIAISLGSMLE